MGNLIHRNGVNCFFFLNQGNSIYKCILNKFEDTQIKHNFLLKLIKGIP